MMSNNTRIELSNPKTYIDIIPWVMKNYKFSLCVAILAAILDSEKAKPLASSHPRKIESMLKEL